MVNWSGVSSRSLLGRVLRAPLRMFPSRMVLPIRSGPARGMRWRVGAATHGCWLGTYELEKQRELARVIRPGMTIYDVGANAGFYTLLFARLTGPRGRVIAFEPFPENAANLLDHVSMNRLDNVTLVQAPLSARRELASFRAGASSSMGALSEVETPLRMLTVTMDELIASYGVPQPDVVKMDVEGAESDVLRGAEQLLARRKTVWFISLHGEAQRLACAALLTDAGYLLSSLVGDGISSWTDAADEIIATPEARKQG